MWKPDLRKITGRWERVHYFQDVKVNSADSDLISEYNGIMVWGVLFSLLEGKSFLFCPLFFSFSHCIYTGGGFIGSVGHADFNNCMICTLLFFCNGLDSALDGGSDFCYLL